MAAVLRSTPSPPHRDFRLLSHTSPPTRIKTETTSPGVSDDELSGLERHGADVKRKIDFSEFPLPSRNHQPATVARRNARERNRVKQVNNGFAALKQHIPLGHRAKKMSKVETLRCAVDYIRNLQTLLHLRSQRDSGRRSEESDFSSFPHSPASSAPSSPLSSQSQRPAQDQNSFLRNEAYENYDPRATEDDDLLDAIALWQNS